MLRGRGCGCSASSRWSPVDKCFGGKLPPNKIWKNEKKTHYISQFATSLSTSLRTFYIDSSIKSLQIADLFATCQVSHRQVCAAVSQCQNRHSQKNGGSCWTRWTHYASSRTPNSTYVPFGKKKAKILTQQFFVRFFSIHFVPQKIPHWCLWHRGYNAALACLWWAGRPLSGH